jgi:hypothetical protein
MSASNIKGCYIIDGTGAFNSGILLVPPIDTFNAWEFTIQTGIVGRIAVTILETT